MKLIYIGLEIWLLLAFVGAFVTQVLLPLLRDRPLFPLLRRKPPALESLDQATARVGRAKVGLRTARRIARAAQLERLAEKTNKE